MGNLRNLFIKRLGIDLTGKVDMLTSVYHIPQMFKDVIGYPNDTLIRGWMNDYGPMFIIHTPDEIFIYQKQGRNRPYLLMGSDGNVYSEEDLLFLLGIPPIGMSVDDIVNTFGEEE